MPMIGQPNNTIKMPPKKAADPLALCHWTKNRNVLSSPITNAKPLKNKIYIENIDRAQFIINNLKFIINFVSKLILSRLIVIYS